MPGTPKILRNTAILYLKTLVSMGVAFYTSRVLLQILGTDDFGVFNVVFGFVLMLTFLSGSLATATQRYLCVESQFSAVFYTSLLIHTVIAGIILMLGETVGVWFVKNHLVFPVNRIEAVWWTYQVCLFGVSLSVAMAPFLAVLLAKEKMNVVAGIGLLESLMRLIVVVVLTKIPGDSLIVYSVLSTLILIVVHGLYAILSIPHIPFTPMFFQKSFLKGLTSFAGWNTIGVVAYLVNTQGLNVILNLFFGPAVNAARGIAMQVGSAASSLTTSYQMALTPRLMQTYSAPDKESFYNSVILGSKFSFFLMFIAVLPLVFHADWVLGLWLKNVPAHASSFAILLMVAMLTEALSKPLEFAVQASGKIRGYQVVLGAILLLNLPVSYALLSMGFWPESVFIINIAMWFLCLVFRIWFAQRSFQFPAMRMVRQSLVPAALVSFSCVFLGMIITFGIPHPLVSMIFVGLAVAAGVWSLGMNAQEKRNLTDRIRRKFCA